jgi:uncharacterized delta-60 repeat protein
MKWFWGRRAWHGDSTVGSIERTAGEGYAARKLLWLMVITIGIVATLIPQPTWASVGLDPSFDGDGKVVTQSPSGAYRVSPAPDESMLVLERDVDRFRLTRYLADGSLDSGYGNNGIVEISLDDICPGCWEMDALAIALQSDGQAVVGGTVTEASGTFENQLGFVARFDTDGGLDPSFGNAGSSFADLTPRDDTSWFTALAILPSGDIVAAGTGGVNITLARFSDSGALDTTFGDNGVSRLNLLKGWTEVDDLLVQTDGKLVVSGAHRHKEFILARLQSDGSPDTSFANGGIVTTMFARGRAYTVANDVALQADDKYVVAGSVGGTMTLARYSALGAIDPTFGHAGKIRTRLWAQKAFGVGLTVRPSGTMLVGGSREGKRWKFVVAAFKPSGNFARSFGTMGIITTRFPSRRAYASTAVETPGDKFVIAGGGAKNLLMARYLLT